MDILEKERTGFKDSLKDLHTHPLSSAIFPRVSYTSYISLCSSFLNPLTLWKPHAPFVCLCLYSTCSVYVHVYISPCLYVLSFHFLSFFLTSFLPHIISIPYVHSASSLATCLYLFGYLFFLSFFLIIHIFLSCLPVCLCLSLSTCLSLSVSLPVCLSLYLPPLSLAPIFSNKLKSRKRQNVSWIYTVFHI